jgi:hypothetical protein
MLNTYVSNRYFGLDVYTKTEMPEPELPELRGKLGKEGVVLPDHGPGKDRGTESGGKCLWIR